MNGVNSAAARRTHSDISELLNQDEVARLCGVMSGTVYSWRARGQGPRFIRVGGLIRYRRSDVEQWLRSRTITPTRNAAQA